MSADAPTIGVVIPVYRAAEFIEDCVRSVVGQSRPVDKVVLVDDCGGDDSVALAERVLADSPIPHEVVRQPANCGPGRARNTGLARLDTDLVWFVDADDTAAPDFLQTMTEALTSTGADFAVCRTRRVSADGGLLGVDEAPRGAPVVSGTDYARELLRGRAKCYPCTKLFRRDLLGDAPWKTGQAYEDMAPVFSMALRADRVAMLDDPMYRYRLRPGSLSTALTDSTFDLFRVGEQFGALLDDQLPVAADRRGWNDDYLAFRYREVLTSVAHVAMRADHAEGERPDLYPIAVHRVRSQTRWRDVPRLVRTAQLRAAVFVLFMRLSPALYSAVLRWR